MRNISPTPPTCKFDHAFNAAFRQGKHPDWVDEVMSVDVNMTLGRNVVLIHQKAKVFATDCDGRPWLVLVLGSRSAMRDGGHIIIGNAKSHKRCHFVDDKKKGHWEALHDDRLSDTEMEMLSLSSRGYSVEEIAAMMYRSVDTVRYYRKNVFARQVSCAAASLLPPVRVAGAPKMGMRGSSIQTWGSKVSVRRFQATLLLCRAKSAMGRALASMPGTGLPSSSRAQTERGWVSPAWGM